jgi:natural product precursor
MKTKKEKLFFKKLTIANLDNMEMKMISGGKAGTGTLCTEICIPGENPTSDTHDSSDYTCY